MSTYRLDRILPNGERRSHDALPNKRKAATAMFHVLLDNRATNDPRAATRWARHLEDAPLGTPVTAYGYTFTIEQETTK